MRVKTWVTLAWLIVAAIGVGVVVSYVWEEEGQQNPYVKAAEELIDKVEHGLQPAPSTQLHDTIAGRYRAWAGSDRDLSFVRVIELLKSPAIKGDEAAALAAVHAFFKPHALGQGQTQQLLASEEDLLKAAPKLEGQFQVYRRHLDGLNRQLFASDAPRIDGLAQGSLADCYLISTIGSAVHHHPAAVRDMIKQRPDGSYDVTFLDGDSIRVPVLTDGMIVLGSSAGKQGLWLNVLETAYGEHRLAAQGRKLDLPEDQLNYGYPDRVMRLLTGRPGTTVAVQPENADKLRQLLGACVQSKALLVAMVRKNARVPPGLMANHAYTVLDFDPRADRVKIWNPYGANCNFKPSYSLEIPAPAGLEHGYPIENGVFEVPLADFSRIYSWVTHDRFQAE
jgi:hypothetical protein